MKRTLTLVAAILLALSGCGDKPSKNNGTNNGSNDTNNENNVTNNATNNDTCGPDICDPPADECDGDEVVTYAFDRCDSALGCVFTSNATEDCSANGQVCMNGQCVDENLCDGVDCSAPADMCDGETAVTYSGPGTCDPADGMCDFSMVETQEDCAANNQICVDAACVDDLCAMEDCMPPADSCDGDTAVTHSGNGTCDPNDGSCDFTAVEEREDCAMNNQICMNGACVDDPCDGVTCPQPQDECDANDIVQYTGAGMCDSMTGECDYSMVEMRTDCTQNNNQICVNAQCVPDNDPTVTPGSLVVTEILQNPDAVSDGDGEFFEIYNPTNRTLDLQGVVFRDAGSDSFSLPTGTAIDLPGRSYYVLGRSDDTGVNGGIAVDYAYGTAMTLANGDDEVIIEDGNGTEIDRVEYDGGTVWPDPTGQSMIFGSGNDPDSDDNNDGSLWCGSSTASASGDLGTPGAANDSCAAMTVTIYDIQDESAMNHPAPESTVSVSGAVITHNDGSYVFAQDPMGGQYSGIFIYPGSVDVSSISAGDMVDFEGRYTENSPESGTSTYSAVVLSSITATGNGMVTPERVETSVFADPMTIEPWEGVLVELVEPGVTKAPLNNFGEFLVDNQAIVDDLLYDQLIGNVSDCDVFDTLTGVVYYSFGTFKIEPRDAADAGTVNAATVTTSLDAMTTMFTEPRICVTAGDTVTWTNQDATNHTVTSRLPTITDPTNNIPTSPMLDLSLEPSGVAGDAQTFTFANPGSYHYRCRPHPTMEGVVVVLPQP